MGSPTAEYQGSYTLPGLAGSKTIKVMADDTFHATELIKAQTGSNDVFNVGYTTDWRDRNYRKTKWSNGGEDSSSGEFSVPSLKSILVGGIVLYGLSLFGGNASQLKQFVPDIEVPQVEQQINIPTSNPFDNVTQFSEHHIDESIPEFFNTELQDDVVDGLGQDWDN